MQKFYWKMKVGMVKRQLLLLAGKQSINFITDLANSFFHLLLEQFKNLIVMVR